MPAPDTGRRSLLWVLGAALPGCAEPAKDPLSCQFESDLLARSAEGKPAAEIAFAGEFGRAPARMRTRVVIGTKEQLAVQACGFDADGREWELQLGLMNLPGPSAYPLDVELEAGERLSVDNPEFWGQLGLCGEHGCGLIEKWAFARLSLSNVAANYHIESYDPEQGQFDGEFWARPGSPNPQPTTHGRLRMAWDAAALRRDRGDVAGSGGAGEPSTP